MLIDKQKLSDTQSFWNANPCGVQGGYEAKRFQRYAMEPYLPDLLSQIADYSGSILEVGCGQGVDAFEICKSLNNGSYIGLDYSIVSIENAKEMLADVPPDFLKVIPIFEVGNAENLNFTDNSFDLVWSMGVIHHTPSIENAISEIRRVLKPNGSAYIMVYRRYSLKVSVALLLRKIQSLFDLIFKEKNIIYKVLRPKHSHSKSFGTMFLECFGVPVLNAYTKKELEELFDQFSHVSITPYGSSFGRLLKGHGSGINRFGYFWLILAKK